MHLVVYHCLSRYQLGYRIYSTLAEYIQEDERPEIWYTTCHVLLVYHHYPLVI